MKVLVTAFGPFPGAPVNPTPALAASLARDRRLGLRIAAHVFRTVWSEVARDLPAVIARHRPDLVLMLGLAGRSRPIRLELMARPVSGVLKRDATGRRPRAGSPAGPQLRRTRLPVARLLAAVRATGVPARLSRDAGRYLCNFAYWHALAPENPPVLFVHVPLPRHDRPALLRALRALLADLGRRTMMAHRPRHGS